MATSAVFSAESARWRKEGNEFYYQATKQEERLAPIIRKSRLQDALRCYQKSMMSASEDDLDGISSSAKNYAKASYCFLNYADDFKQKIFYYKTCFEYYSKAILSGKKCKCIEWQHEIEISFRSLYEETLEFCHIEVQGLSEKTAIFESFASVIDQEDSIYPELFREIATMWLNDACMALNENDFKGSLYSLKEMYHPIEQVRRFGKYRHDLMDELETMEQDMTLQMARTESLQLLHISDELLESHLDNDEELNMDLLYTIIDNYRQCMILTREKEMEIEAIALSRLGRIYDQVLKIKYRAKICFQTCIQIALSLAPRNFATEPWFKLATDTLERFQKETIQYQEEEKEKERQKYLKELEAEMKLLKEGTEDFKKDDAGFLLFVYANFPPKKTCKIPKLKDVEGKNKDVLKKYYIKAVSQYHPDKQDVERFGMKWKILSGEITKILTRVYEGYKTMN